VKIVVALGGNALLRRGEPLTVETQRRNVKVAADSVAALAESHDIVVTHGNGPQVGLLALQAHALAGLAAYPLDVLGAESVGMIGYLLQQELRNRVPGRDVVTLLTQVEVDANDPAFAQPTKPIGPVYARDEAERLRTEHGWHMAPDGAGWRRVVASPQPRRVLEIGSIRTLARAGALVICVGGGGVPVVIDEAGVASGVEAVVDKDLAASLLATELAVDALLLLTDVDAVYRDWESGRRDPIAAATPAVLRGIRFAVGTMAPKVEAACRFVERNGALAAIGSLERAESILRGTSGTRIVPAGENV
jgi:carbamate kinase